MSDPSRSHRESFEAFLQAMWADYAAGCLKSITEYGRQFPDCPLPRIRNELDQIEGPEDDSSDGGWHQPVSRAGFEDIQQIAGYTLLRKIGEGGMGIVFESYSPAGKTVAVKIPFSSGDRDSHLRRRFGRETRIALSLDHPRLVRALDGGHADGHDFLVSEFVDGPTLASILDEHGPLGERVSRVVMADLLDALVYLEDSQLIHRDLKPSNVFVEKAGSCLVGDYGLARSTSPGRSIHTVGRQFLGTMAFASPEQLMGKNDIDIRSDLYSLGVILFCCITGKPPVPPPDLPTLIRNGGVHFIPDVSLLEDSASTDLADFVVQLLSRRREDRPESADAARREARAAGLTPSPTDRCVLAELCTSATNNDSRGSRVSTAIPAKGFNPVTCIVSRLDREPADHPATRFDMRPPTSSRLHLRIIQDEVSRDVVVHGATELVMGGRRRHPLEDVLPLPLDHEDERALRISARHLRIFLGNDGLRVEDLASRGGTLLDDAPLIPDAPELLGPTSEVELAGVLTLTLRQAGPADIPSLWIEEVGARTLHAMVPRCLILPESLQLLHRHGRFALETPSGALPLVPGAKHDLPGLCIQVVDAPP